MKENGVWIILPDIADVTPVNKMTKVRFLIINLYFVTRCNR